MRNAWWFVLVGCSSKSQELSKASAPLEHPSPSAVVALARSAVKPATPIPRPGSDAKWIDTRALAPRFEVVVPERSVRPLRIASGGYAIAVVPEVLDRAVAKVDGASLFTDVAPATDLVYLSAEDSVEELRVLHTASAPTTFRWRIQRDGLTLRLREGFVEALDEAGRARLRMAPIVAVDAHGLQRSATVELRGDLLEARLDASDLAFPVVLDPAWGNTATMGVTRSYLSAVVLSSGKVMAIGGQTTPSAIHKSAEIYDPATNTWTLTASMTAQRSGLAATTLPSGKVLATGGGDAGNGAFCTSTAELYAPATDSWSAAGSFPGGTRGRHAQVLLKTGKVFAAGGASDCRAGAGQANGAVYDPATNTWTATTGTWATGTRNAAIGVLPDGRVMVAHGSPGLGTTTATHLYDPGTNAVSAGPSAPGVGRDVHAFTSLADGRLLIAGGIQFAGSWSGLSTTEVYDGPGAAFIGRAPLPLVRVVSALTTLSTGKALLAGGTNYTNPGDTASQLYDPVVNTWTPAGTSVVGRAYGALLPLSAGQAIFVGGQDGDYSSVPGLSTAEIYAASLPTGIACLVGAACASGFCVDGVCCDGACAGQCQACKETGKVGTCTTVSGVPRGTRAACSGTGACGGSCDGATITCTYPPATTACVTASCSGGVANGAAYCSGAGACGTAPAPVTCAPYTCGAVACKASCLVDADCVATHWCDATSKCVPRKKAGDACKLAVECTTGFCETGVCCDKACGGACESCKLSGSEGVCSSIPGCEAGVADTGAETTTDAGSDTGVLDTGASDAIADAPAPTLPPIPKVEGAFQRCARDSECATGFCVDGVCCDTRCADRCHSCALLSNPGKCTLEPTGVDLRNECGPSNQCLGTCGPSGMCIGSGTGTMCGRNRCTGASTGAGPVYCASPGAKCPTNDAVAFDCQPYACDPAFGACRTQCVTSQDCANGFACDPATRSCLEASPPPAADGGCATAPGSSAAGWVAGAGLLALLGRARRRAARR